MSESFADLRLNTQDSQNGESFWPSFTDIMTVIVMIFLIAMVVLLIRNVELLNQLRATMEAERVAAELAKTTGEEKESLAMQLHIAEQQIADLQLRLLQVEEDRTDKERTITDQLSRIANLTSERDALRIESRMLSARKNQLESQLEVRTAKLTTAEQRISGLNQQVQNLQTVVGSLEQNLTTARERMESTQAEITQMQTLVAEQQITIEQFREQEQLATERYKVMESELDSLQVKYNKLIGPKRSPAGRYVVEVRYAKIDGVGHIEYREDPAGPLEEISRAELDRRLNKLKQDKQQGLYVKVVFPDDSGLSFNEAWAFTSEMHKGYDYYFQETANPEETTVPEQQPASGQN